TRTWALEETGRNSVSAWTRPRMTASMNDMDSPRRATGVCGAAPWRRRTPDRVRGAGRVARRRAAQQWLRVRGGPGDVTRGGEVSQRSAPGAVLLLVALVVVVVVILVVVVLVVEVIEVVEVVVLIIVVVAVEDDQGRGDV